MRVAAALIAIAVLGGCGHSDSANTETTPPPPQQSPSAPTPAPATPGPTGELSAAEYRSIVREYTLLEPLRGSSSNDSGLLRRSQAACGTAPRPDTRLMQLVRLDCLNALSFFKAFAGVRNVDSACARPTQAARDTCISQRYGQLANALRTTVANALLIDKELIRRHIGGVCGRSIGITRSDATAMVNAARAAADGAAAAVSQDDAGFVDAQQRLAQALASESTNDALIGIKRACKHARAATQPKRKRRHAVPPPGRAKPRIPGPSDRVAA